MPPDDEVDKPMSVSAFLTGAALRLLARPSLAATRARRGPRSLRRHGVNATITRDERGIPWITAETETDLCFASGYAQAQDRLWQMDLMRRRAQGRLSEIFGAATVGEDTRVRRLAIARMARESEALLSPRAAAALASFGAGVDAAARTMARRAGLPPEFLLLRYRPEPWTAGDTLAIVKMNGFDLAKNLGSEAFRARLAEEAPDYQEAFTLPKYPDNVPTTIRQKRAGTARIAPSADASAVGLPPSISDWLGATGSGEGPGSNAWAVAGSRTASGRPLLANDPHLVFTQPNVWYQIGLRLDDGERRSEGYGVTLPGIPGLVAGANDDLAFGITNATVDTQDLCLLDADQQLPDAWTEETTVKVRGGADVPVRASGSTGCVELEVAALGGRRCALFWSGYWPSSEIDGSLDTWRARSYPEFRDALRHFGVPVLNHIVAAADGTIALKTAGRVPAREPGSGLRPAGFDEVARSWRGFLEFDELPEVVDPDEGYLVSANNKLLPEDDPRHLGVDWAGAYRAPRIDELLDATDAVTDQDCARWQLDVANLRARRLLPHLLAAFDQSAFDQDRPVDEPDAACLKLLRDWDHRDAPELAAPLIFAALLDELAEDWIVSRLGKELAAAMPDSPLQLDHLVVDARARVALGVPEQLRDSVPAAFARAVARLVEKWGDDPRRWRNDTAHRIADSHLLGRAVPLLGSLFGGTRTPVGASLFSVRLMQPDATGAIAEGAPWRFVAEVGPGPTARWDVLRHGSSGHPLAPHYEDQTAAHAEGRLYRVSPGFPR